MGHPILVIDILSLRTLCNDVWGHYPSKSPSAILYLKTLSRVFQALAVIYASDADNPRPRLRRQYNAKEIRHKHSLNLTCSKIAHWNVIHTSINQSWNTNLSRAMLLIVSSLYINYFSRLVDFRIQNIFCSTEELQTSWLFQQIPCSVMCIHAARSKNPLSKNLG